MATVNLPTFYFYTGVARDISFTARVIEPTVTAFFSRPDVVEKENESTSVVVTNKS